MAVTKRVAGLDWARIRSDLGARGFAQTGPLLQPDECDALASLYPEAAPFRSHIVMARHGFGQGEYKYFAHPLPDLIGELRAAVYPHLVPVANRWLELLGRGERFPEELEEMLARCHAAGQSRPTPLLLRYQTGDFNCLHQDVYGEHVFPLQVVICLNEPGRDFEGGEFVVVEQRPRMQSKAEVVPLRKGEAAIFAVRHRPHKGAKGYYRVNLKHGVSRIRSGLRHTCGIIFHDAA
ncbi:MAG: 2OG-Fe(II) oxygenase [Beijerinckiaceae bacterium]|nr:2OG-Fe(II) oxygenase [Beijerinckiaceae bacterium]